MLKEELTDWVTAYKDAAERNALTEDPDESADYLISLFKVEVDKLTMMTDAEAKEEVLKYHCSPETTKDDITISDIEFDLMALQVEHVKKQLLDVL